jgi:prefoldin subunit 5
MTVTAEAVKYERAETQALEFIEKNINLLEESIKNIKSGVDHLSEPLKQTFDYGPFF